MNAATCHAAVAPSRSSVAPCHASVASPRPLHRRLIDRFNQVASRAWAVWERIARVRRARRDAEAIADMNEALLRDIGAPDWLVAEAAARRETSRLALEEMRREQAIGRLQGLQ